MRKKFIVLGLLLTFLSSTGLGCRNSPKEAVEGMKPVTLNYWRVWDGPDEIRPLIEAYNKVHPNITIKYRKLRYDEYEQELINALAEDRGPDIFSIHASWTRGYQSKIAVMPAQLTLAYPVVRGTLKKEVFPELRTTRTISLSEIKNVFTDTVYKDVVFDWYNSATKQKELRVHGLPLAMDTMVMYYNRDLLNNANIGELSGYWNNQFKKDIKKLTKQNSQGEISQAGIAMGSGSNIERSPDILSAIMMQNGATIFGENGRPAFTSMVRGKDYNPGVDAIRFYSDFANPVKDVYAWNAKLDNSLKMFTEGRLAVMFGYAYHLPTIRAQAPKLNFGIRPMPQIEGSSNVKNVADYWVETVSKKSKYQTEAWDFIQFITTKPEVAKLYLQLAKRPTALRSLIEEQKNDNDLSVFANQLLTATTWYRGYDYKAGDQIFKDMLDAINDNPSDLEREARVAEGKLLQTVDAPKTE